jgi:Flp pilus assembly protein TadD
VSEFRNAIRCDPHAADTHSNLGLLLHDLHGDNDGAECEYSAAIWCDTNNADFYFNLGRLLYNVRKDYEGAKREYSDAILCDQDDAGARARLVEVLQLAAAERTRATTDPIATTKKNDRKKKGAKKG